MKQKSQPVIAIPEKDGYGFPNPLFCDGCGRKLVVELGDIFQFQGKPTQSINTSCPKSDSFWALLMGQLHTRSRRVGWNENPDINAKYNSQTGKKI